MDTSDGDEGSFMMAVFEMVGGKPPAGEMHPGGAKNAALPIPPGSMFGERIERKRSRVAAAVKLRA